MINAFDASQRRQMQFIADVHRLWWARKFSELFQLVMSGDSPMQDLFDANDTPCLLRFVGLGGIDVVARMLADSNVNFDTAPPVNVISLYKAFIRLMTELLIVSPSFAWYLVDAHRAMYSNLLRMCSVRRLWESILSILEHTVSAVGPAILLEKCPALTSLLSEAEGVEVGLASRVVALLIVPSLAPDKNEREPYPQCLRRVGLIETTIDANVRFVLDHPTLLKKIIGLVEPLYYRRYTRDMEIPGSQAAPFSFMPAPGGGGGFAIQFPPGANMAGLEPQLVQQLLAGGFGGMMGGQDLHADPYDNDPDDWEDDDDDDDGGDSDGDSDSDSDADGPAAAGAGAPAGGPAAGPAGGPNWGPGGFGADPLAAVAEAVEHAAAEQQADEEPPPAAEALDCAWFTGVGSCGDQLWRQRDVVLVEPTGPTPTALRNFASQNSRPLAKSPKTVHSHIYNAQSEMLFVLNTLLCTAYHRRAWSVMCQYGLLPKLRTIFPLMFDGSRSPARAVEAPAPDDADSDSDSDAAPDNHTHEPPTLRKIELMRLLHEYWDAHDIDECVRLRRTDVAENRLALADLVAKHLTAYEEDVCVENLMCFGLEAFIRSFWVSERCVAQSRLSWMLPSLVSRLFPRRQPGPTLRTPAHRRLESTFTLLGELCKYNAENWGRVGSLLVDGGLEQSLLKAMLRNTFESSFFLRSLVISAYPEIRSRRARAISADDLVAMRKTREDADPELIDSDNSDEYARRTFERQEVVLGRMYTVRVLAADFCRRRVTDADEIFEAVTHMPSACDRETRRKWLAMPYSCVPSAESPVTLSQSEAEEATDFTPGKEDVSAIASLPSLWPQVQAAMPKLFRNLMAQVNCEEVETADHMCVLTTSIAIVLCAYRRGGEDAVEELLAAAIRVHDDDRAEVISAHARQQQAYVRRIAIRKALAARRRAQRRADRGARAADSDDDAHGHHAHAFGSTHHQADDSDSDFSASSSGSGDNDHDEKLCPNCDLPPTTQCPHKRVRAINDLAANYYRVLVAWAAHYAVQQNYFMTLFFCSEIDVPRWKAIVAVLFRVLPKFFKPPTAGTHAASA